MEQAYNACITSDNMLFTSGQISIDTEGRLIGENDIEAQTTQALNNLFEVLATQGFTVGDIVKTEVHLQNIERDFDRMNNVYIKMMNSNKPARVTVGSTLFKPEFLIEISATAVKTKN